ncbi:hypothetical protein PanWU01x14_115120 [Parasponia andersonii]|uniref:Uncharacterized protein n=1 Tax=Parasponia andersonii TaxID=3476 RepID=A0A2P5CXJ1_PARAD|nr:hypothetical protein PanWU01x14_115120 [Parasponia andersonii]
MNLPQWSTGQFTGFVSEVVVKFGDPKCPANLLVIIGIGVEHFPDLVDHSVSDHLVDKFRDVGVENKH